MKQKVSNDLIIGLKEYFKMSAFTYTHRKRLDEIKRTFPATNSRTIRRAIEVLKKDHAMQIVGGANGFKGYFVVDKNNDQDRGFGWDYYCKLMKHNSSIYLTALTFKSLRPSNVIRLDI